MLTYSQPDWHNNAGAAGFLLVDNFGTVYSSNGGVAEIGAPGASITFDSAPAIQNYLPASGPVGTLTASLFDPTDSPSGVFGGDVLALQLDVDFADAGLLEGSLGLKFGDLQLYDTYACLPDGTSVRDLLAEANTALGGGSTPCSIDDLDVIALSLTIAFNSGVPSTFAQDSLVAPGGTSGGGGTNVPEPSSVLLLGVGLLGLGIFQYRRRASVSSMAA